MSKYINGEKVLDLLGIESFELIGLARDEKLRPFNKQGKPICDLRKKEEFEKQDGCVLYLKQIELGSVLTARSMPGKQNYHRFNIEDEKARLQGEIKKLEAKGVSLLDMTKQFRWNIRIVYGNALICRKMRQWPKKSFSIRLNNVILSRPVSKIYEKS